MSSNFNPMPFWLYGSQMVALNFQALGLATLLNLGRFLENGSVGYVLKPAILRQPNYPFDPSAPFDPVLHRMVQEHPMRIKLQVNLLSSKNVVVSKTECIRLLRGITAANKVCVCVNEVRQV